MNLKDNKITIITEDNEKLEVEIIACVRVLEKDFLVYTDNKTVTNGNISLKINSFVKEDGEVLLKDVTDDEERKVIEELRKRLV